MLTFKPLGIDAWQEHVIYLHPDCPVCRAEGFTAQARVEVRIGARSLIATLNLAGAPLLHTHEAALSSSAANELAARAGDQVAVSHAPTLDSLRAVRAKIYGDHLDDTQVASIVGDIAGERYTDMQLAAFLTACAGNRMTDREIIGLTRAMVGTGEQLTWDQPVVADKHCVGGLPGNRTTPIIVAIAAAAGLTIPKTSSRAITSPAGTAETMETLTRVTLDTVELRRVVESVGAALVWGGALNLSPADDIMIRVERALDIDSDAQLVASILSKKVSAGATHVLIDVPVGPTAKVRSQEHLLRIESTMLRVAKAFRLQIRMLQTDGSQPVGRGIGPALEAHDVLAVLQREALAPADLRARALLLSGALLEFCGSAVSGHGMSIAERLLDSGAAWSKFQEICEAQGGLTLPGRAIFRRDIVARRSGHITSIDNRRLARAAKLAGAPLHQVAGVEMRVRLHDEVIAGQPLLTVHAQALGELDYAYAYALANPAILISDSGVCHGANATTLA
ncbi:thymidine phosphorylase family protein [Cupriavidus pauculus]|uniref:thymidine phosphorylase family protein n=1 Tax=Cupriavidus pauculus TaxID=82633 RepID=UPI00078347A4|nr:thymidine phosphorylase family protein [Cupriavidus pauculus]